jgi:hypothetical protein
LARANAGDLAGALAEHRQALALRRALQAADAADSRARIDTAESLGQIARVQGALGDHPAALASWRESLALRRALTAGDPANAHSQDELASDLEGIGLEQLQAGDRAGGIASLREAVALRAQLTVVAADLFDNRVHGARLLASLGRSLAPAAGPPGAEACALLRRSVEQFAALRASPGLAGEDADAATAAAHDAARCAAPIDATLRSSSR